MKRGTVEERVDYYETGYGDSDSDLDMVPSSKAAEAGRKRLTKLIEKEPDVVDISSDSDHDEGGSDRKRRKITEPVERSKVSFDDDEDSDTVYKNFKNRKAIDRKKAKEIASRRKTKAAKGSMVGLRPTKAARPRNEAAQVYGDSDDDELLDEELPENVKERRREFDVRREELGNAGLLLPPDSEDLYFSDDEHMADLKEKPYLPHIKPCAPYKDIELPKSAGIIPAPIAQYLRDYQVQGAEFLHQAFVYQQGCILGDDMGLGKTIQVIAFLTAAFGKVGDERDAKRMRKMRRLEDGRWYPRVIIICPGSLMENWKAELARWGWWDVSMFHGQEKEAALASARNGRLEIMLTTYSTYRICEQEINCVEWDCVIADECHTLKEKNSKITKAMNNINSLCRIGLSGTAIQNRYEELWTLLNWTNPGRFGGMRTWKTQICIPLKMGQSHDATISQLAKARRTATKLVNNLLPRFFLRRTKALIADQLPKKSDRVVFCPLTETQADAYNNFCDSEILHVIRDVHLPCDCGREGAKQGWCCHKQVMGKKWQHWVFPCLITLQKLSNHVALLIPAGEASSDEHEKAVEKLSIAMPEIWKDLIRSRDSIMNYANQDFCGKWRVLKKLLKLWHDNGDKVLVFSHSVRLLRMLDMLFKSTTSYNVSYLDGKMPYEDRQKAVDAFNCDPLQFVFLISTKAGGVGLNITSANKVVVFDPNWNPSYDLQAQDRAYRIGQTRDVDVFRLISAGTIEEVVYARQIYKQQQANIGYNASLERRYFKGVQNNADMKGEIFGLTNLFAPHQANSVKLMDIVNKTNIAETQAGLQIAGLDFEASQDDVNTGLLSEDGIKEGAAISDLAADIIDEPASRRRAAGETAQRKDPVVAILASVGVEYTHENAEVIGTSRIETKLSSRAQKAGNDVDYSNDAAFGQDKSPSANTSFESVYTSNEGEGPSTARYRYRPNEDIRRRQFCTMAKQFGYEDVTEFALVVEGWKQEQRRDCLDKFYRDRRAKLNGQE